MINDTSKTVIWVNSAKEKLLEFPEDVIDEVGYILYRVQTNQTHTVPQIKLNITLILLKHKNFGQIQIV